MARRWRVRKGDQVIVNAGKDKGKIGEVLRVLRDQERVVVKGVNLIKKHKKPSTSSEGGIVTQEASLHISNVMHVDPKSDQPTRVGVKLGQDGQKVRYAKKSGEIIDSKN